MLAIELNGTPKRPSVTMPPMSRAAFQPRSQNDQKYNGRKIASAIPVATHTAVVAFPKYASSGTSKTGNRHGTLVGSSAGIVR